MRKSINNKDGNLIFKYKNNVFIFLILFIVFLLIINIIVDLPISFRIVSLIFMFLYARAGINNYGVIKLFDTNIQYKNICKTLILKYEDITYVNFTKSKGGYWVEFYFLKESKLNSFSVSLTDDFYAIRIKKVIQSKDIKIRGDTKLL